MCKRGMKKKYNHFMVLLTAVALLFGNLVFVSTAWAGGPSLAFTGGFANSTPMVENNPAANTNTPLQPIFKFSFGNGVTGTYFDTVNNTHFQLVKVSDSSSVTINVYKGDSSGATNKDIVVNLSSPLEYSTKYKITCTAGVTANNTNYTGSDHAFYFTTIDKPANPTISSATLSGGTLILDGLNTGKSMEYYIDASGTANIGSVSVTDWVYMNTVSGATYSIALSNPNLTPGTSKVYVHFKGDTTAPPAWATVKGGFGAGISIAQGHTYALDNNVNVSVPALTPASPGASPTINLRNAASEVPSGNVMPSMQYYSRLKSAGGVFGVTVNGATYGTSIQLSLPVQLSANDASLKSKTSVYLLDRSNPQEYRWVYQKSTDRTDIANNVIKVTADVQSANQDLVYGIFYDNVGAEAVTSRLVSKTDHSLTIDFLASDESDIVEFDVVRTEVVSEGDIPGHYVKSLDPGKKISFSFKNDQSNNQITNYEYSHNKATYTDTDVETGKIYNYQIIAVEDSVGNRLSPGFDGRNLTPDSDENIVQRIKNEILSHPTHFLGFKSQDNADSVTQDIASSPAWIVSGTEITWTSSRPDIIMNNGLRVDKTAVVDPVTVNLTANIKYENTTDSSIVIPVTVRWTSEPTVNSFDELKAAIHSDQVTTIISRNFIAPAYQETILDFKGKTLKPSQAVLDYGGAFFIGINAGEGSKLTVSNVVIDMGGMSVQKIFYSSGGQLTLNNVKVIGSENSNYSLMGLREHNVNIFNSSFAPVKVANIWSEKLEGYPSPSLHISGSTFDGGGNPGNAIYSNAASTIENNVIRNYHANDNSSAGIFIDSGADASISANTVTGSDIGIKVATSTAGVNSAKINGETVSDVESARSATNSLLQIGNSVETNLYSVVVTDKASGNEVYKLSAFPFIPGSFAPAAGAVNAPIDSAIQFQFTGNDGLKINPSTLDGNVTLSVYGAAVPASVSIDPSTNIVTIAPSHKLQYGTTYTVTVSKNVADASGNTMPMDIGWKFTTVPLAAFLNPSAGAPWDVEVDTSLKIGFTVPVNPGSISAGQSVALQLVGGESVGFNYDLSADGKLLTVTPTQHLIPGAQYKLTLSAPLSDMEGNTIGSPQSITFLTQSGSIAETPVITELGGSSSPVTELKAGRNYTLGIEVTNNTAVSQTYAAFFTARAGKGARLELGGKVFQSNFKNLFVPASSTVVANLYSFTVPDDATDVYIDIYLSEWSADGRFANRILAKPKHLQYKVQH